MFKKMFFSKTAFNIYLLTSVGLLMTLSFTPFNLWPVGFFCFIPLFIFVERNSSALNLKNIWLWGAIPGIAVSLFAYQWLIHTIEIYGNMPLPIAVLVFLLYAVSANLRFSFFLLLVVLRNRYTNPQNSSYGGRLLQNNYFFIPVSFSLCEYFSWQLYPVFGANLVSSNLVFMQFADTIGVLGLSLAWIFLSFSFFRILKGALAEKSFSQLLLVLKQPWHLAAIVLFIFLHIYGFFAIRYWEQVEQQLPAKTIAVVQGDTPLAFKEIRDMRAKIREITVHMVDESIELGDIASSQKKKISLMVWPEGSVPFSSYKHNDFLRDQVKRMHDQYPIQLIFNDIDDLIIDKKRKYFSNMSLIDSNGQVLENYHKVYLLPFGEYMPLSDTFPFLADMIAEVSNFTKGSIFKLFESNAGLVLPVICYEIIPPQFIPDFYRTTGRKAQILINITNDSWFGQTQETLQHFELGIVRSIEIRRPLVRATNSGLSGYVTVTGEVKGKSKLFDKDRLLYDVKVPSENEQSVFAYIGYWPLWLIYSFYGLIFIGGFIRRRRG